MKYILSTIVSLFLVTSCVSLSQNTSKDSNYPSWYLNPIQNSSANLYGVGEGYTMQEASIAALNNLASKLAVTISSKSESLLEEINDDNSQEFSRVIKEKVQDISFNNYKISRSGRVQDRFYAEVSVDRDSFIKEQQSLLKQNNDIKARLYLSSKNRNILITRNKLSEIKSLISKSIILNQILRTLDSNPNFEKNIKRYQSYIKSYDEILDKIIFRVKSKDKDVKDVIIEALNDANMKVADQNIKNSNNLVTIVIYTSSNVKKIYGSKITNLKVKFKLLSNKNKILNSNITEATGASVGNDQDSYQMAVKTLAKKIKKEGILKIIGAEND